MALEQLAEQRCVEKIIPNQKTIWENQQREDLAHNFLSSGIIHDLLYKTNVDKFRKVQLKTYVGVIRMLFLGIDEGYIKLPTGAGKTLFFTILIDVLQLASLIKAPTTDIIGQNIKQLIENGYDKDAIFTIPNLIYNEEIKGFERGKNASAATILTDILEQIDERSLENPVIGSTYASLKSLFKNHKHLLDRLKSIIKFYVSDEAHETMGERGSELKEFFMDREHGNPESKVHIQLSATIDRKKKSLRDKYHEIANIKLQECFEDEILIRPSFVGVGNAYLPFRGGIDKKPSDYEIESSGKFVDKEGKSIREVLIDKYAELKKRFIYFPGQVFCRTIKETKDVIKYAENVHGLRTIAVTSENETSIAEISKMIYNDEVDLVVTVSKLAQGTDIRPLRASLRVNASNDPVYKTQGNGRIMRTMKEEDVTEIMGNLRRKTEYDRYSDAELEVIVRKNIDNTCIIEPDKWIVTVPGRVRLPSVPGGRRKKYVPTTKDTLDELPNSMEDMFLCDEVDSSYLSQHYPTASLYFKDMVEFLKEQKIESIEDILTNNPAMILYQAETRFTGSKYQKLRAIFQPHNMSDLDEIAEFLGFKKLSKTAFDNLYRETVRNHIKGKDIFTLREHYEYLGSEESPATFPIWNVKHEYDIRRSGFDICMKAYGRDMVRELKNYLQDIPYISILTEGNKNFTAMLAFANILRENEGQPSFKRDVNKDTFYNYLYQRCGLPTLRDQIIKIFLKHKLKTVVSTVTWQLKNTPEMQMLNNDQLLKILGIRAKFKDKDVRAIKKAIREYAFGREEAHKARIQHFSRVMCFEDDINNIFDIYAFVNNGIKPGIIRSYFGHGRKDMKRETFRDLAVEIFGEYRKLEEDLDLLMKIPWNRDEVGPRRKVKIEKKPEYKDVKHPLREN